MQYRGHKVVNFKGLSGELSSCRNRHPSRRRLHKSNKGFMELHHVLTTKGFDFVACAFREANDERQLKKAIDDDIRRNSVCSGTLYVWAICMDSRDIPWMVVHQLSRPANTEAQ